MHQKRPHHYDFSNQVFPLSSGTHTATVKSWGDTNQQRGKLPSGWHKMVFHSQLHWFYSSAQHHTMALPLNIQQAGEVQKQTEKRCKQKVQKKTDLFGGKLIFLKGLRNGDEEKKMHLFYGYSQVLLQYCYFCEIGVLCVIILIRHVYVSLGGKKRKKILIITIKSVVCSMFL